MGAFIHVLWAVLLVAIVGICLAKFGKRPKSVGEPLVGFFCALIIACFGFALTVGSAEGTASSKHFFMYLIGSWLLLTFIEPKKRAPGLAAGLFFYVLCHRIEYRNLSHSSNYTDNPQERLALIKGLNKRRRRKGLAPIQNVQIQRGWHTWLTDLYEVKPPAGGNAASLDLSRLPDKPESE